MLDLLPETYRAPWRNDPATLDYLSELTGASITELESRQLELEAQSDALVGKTEELAYTNYKAFIRAATCARDIFEDFTAVETRNDRLLDILPQLSSACTELHERARNLSRARRRNTLALQHHAQVLDILEMPQLMETCVKGRYYDEALRLRAHAARLCKKHGDIAVVRDVSAGVERGAQQMEAALLQQLRGNVPLTACLSIVGHLRTLGSRGESELRLLFLHARDAWLRRELTLPTADACALIIKTIEVNRIHLFAIITQYRAIFSSGMEAGEEAFQSGGVLYDWMLQRVTAFLHVLNTHLPRISEGLAPLLEQCMQLAASLARHGVDFRSLLQPIFERAVESQYARALEHATQRFKDSLPAAQLATHSLSSQRQVIYVRAAPGQPVVVPLALMGYAPLAVLTNAMAGALNDVRDCAPLSVALAARAATERNLHACATALRDHYMRFETAFDSREKLAFQRLCVLYAGTLVPCVADAFDRVFGNIASTNAAGNGSTNTATANNRNAAGSNGITTDLGATTTAVVIVGGVGGSSSSWDMARTCQPVLDVPNVPKLLAEATAALPSGSSSSTTAAVSAAAKVSAAAEVRAAKPSKPSLTSAPTVTTATTREEKTGE